MKGGQSGAKHAVLGIPAVDSETNLLSSLGLSASGHVGSLQDWAEDGQPLPRLELRGEGQESGVFHCQVGVQLAQNQDLGPLQGAVEPQ